MSAGPVLAAVDLANSDSARGVICEAAFETEVRKRTLAALAVVPEAFASLDWRYVIRGRDRSPPPGERRELVQQTLARLGELASEETPEDVEVETFAAVGSVYQQVLSTARQLDTSLIVIAAGESRWGAEEIGPNAARVARHAPCAVLLVHLLVQSKGK
jgi:universal stress protein F